MKLVIARYLDYLTPVLLPLLLVSLPKMGITNYWQQWSVINFRFILDLNEATQNFMEACCCVLCYVFHNILNFAFFPPVLLALSCLALHSESHFCSNVFFFFFNFDITIDLWLKIASHTNLHNSTDDCKGQLLWHWVT